MTKKKTAPRRAIARAVETRAAKPAATAIQREADERAKAKDLESARTRQQGRRFNKNLTVLQQRAPAHSIKVMATQTGYYDHIRRRAGDVFLIDAAKLEADVVNTDGKVSRKKGEIAAFSSRWMEKVDAATPESVSTANDNIRQQHDELLASRHGTGIIQSQTDMVEDDLPTGEHNPLGE